MCIDLISISTHKKFIWHLAAFGSFIFIFIFSFIHIFIYIIIFHSPGRSDHFLSFSFSSSFLWGGLDGGFFHYLLFQLRATYRTYFTTDRPTDPASQRTPSCKLLGIMRFLGFLFHFYSREYSTLFSSLSLTHSQAWGDNNRNELVGLDLPWEGIGQNWNCMKILFDEWLGLASWELGSCWEYSSLLMLGPMSWEFTLLVGYMDCIYYDWQGPQDRQGRAFESRAYTVR